MPNYTITPGNTRGFVFSIDFYGTLMIKRYRNKQSMKQKEQPAEHDSFIKKKRLIVIMIVSTVGIACLTFAAMLTHGTVKSTYLQTNVSVDTPYEVKLSQRLLHIPLNQITISPRVEGRWSIHRSMTKGDMLRFEQSEAFMPDVVYTVTFNDVRRVTGIEAAVPSVAFKTEAAPGISSVSFEEGATVAADAPISIVLSAKNRGLRDLELQTSPQLAFTMSAQDDMVFTWRSAELLPQGKDITIKVIDKKSGDILVDKTVKVAVAPQLESQPAKTNFGKQDKAKLVFEQPIDQTSGKIKFSLEGDGVWQDDKTYVFTPREVKPGQVYSYIIPKGLRSKEGGILEQEQSYTFATPGAVAVASFSPRGQELTQARQVIRVSFNQAVNKRSAEERTTVSHGTIVSRTWEGNALLLTAINFGVQQTVRVNVAAGIEPLFGLPSMQHQQYSFTTEIPVKKLAVPMHYQQYAQSCEAASLRMALSYRGIQDNDWNILQRFGYNPRPLDKENNEWDDPQQQFVGDVRGNQGKGTGWGVYAEPVARAVRSYGRSAVVQYGVSASFVAQNIHQGNTVILWGIWDETATQKSWKTPDGRTVSGPIPMHVRLVIGVKGRADSPVGFYIHDPITGPTYWSADYMVYNTRRAGAANMAVAVI